VRDDTREDVLITNEPAYDKSLVIDIPGVDTKKGLSLYAGDTNVYLSLLRSYAANTPGLLDRLRNVSAETLTKYNIAVHGLKSSSGSIGARAIRDAALNLEEISRSGDLAGVLALNGKLIADTETIIARVKAWLEQYDANSEQKPLLKSPDRELLKELRQCCRNYDIKGVDKILSVLESSDYEEDGDIVVWVREKIEASEFIEAAERLEQYE